MSVVFSDRLVTKWSLHHHNYLCQMPSSVTPSDNRGEMRLAIRFLPQVTTSKGQCVVYKQVLTRDQN